MDRIPVSPAAKANGIKVPITAVTGKLGIVTAANLGFDLDAISGGFVRLYDNSVPMLVWLASSTTLVTIGGEVVYTQG